MDAVRRRSLAYSCLAALLLLTAIAASAQQQQKGPASGKFEGREWTFEALGAYAFPAEVGMDDVPGIRVAVSNGSFSTERMDLIWDRQHVIDTYFRDEETLVVYFDFDKSGKYQGMSYYFASGDGCGFCYNGAVQSTVKIEKGRIHGGLKQAPDGDDAVWDIQFDVPIAPNDYGTPLPAGGGEQGKIYAAYHTALDGNDPNALKPYLDTEHAADLAEHGPEMLSQLREQHPTKSYKITKGFVKGDNALLLVDGETSIMKTMNEVHLVKIDGTWRVYDEIQQVKLGDG
jgi:hypothetical protein